MFILRTITLGFLLAFSVLAIVIILVYYNNKTGIEVTELAIRTQQVLYNTQRAQQLVTAAEGGSSVYYTTGNQQYVSYVTGAQAAFIPLTDSIRAYSNNAAQQARIDSVKKLGAQQINYAIEVVDAIRAGNRNAAQLLKDSSNLLAPRINALFNDIQQQQNQLLLTAENDTAQKKKIFYATFLALTVGLFSILALLYYAIYHNLGDRTKMESEIRESRNLLHSIINNAPNIIYIKDLDGRYVLVNRQMALMYNKTPTQLVGLNNYDLLPADVADRLRITDEEVIRKNKLIAVEEQAPALGKMYTFIISKFPLHDNKGNVTGIGGVVTDITQRKKYENQLTEAFNNITDLYDHAPCGYHSVDANGLITAMNETELKWLGYTKAEVIGKMYFREIITPENYDAFVQKFEQFKKEGHANNLEFEMKRKDGSTFAVLLNATGIYNDKGEFQYSRSTTYDITERKKAQEEMLSLNQRLEKYIQELEGTNSELNAFTYSSSHDFRAPLRAITSFSTMLRNEYSATLDANFTRMVTIISANAKKMAKLIDDLLIYSRIGRTPITLIEVEMTSFAEKVSEELRDAQEKDFSAKFTFSEQRKVYCDKALMRHVLLSLLDNAIKFSSKSPKPMIHFGSYRVDNETVFFVKDNGVGFDMKYVNKLFGVFQRLHTDVEFDGTGVGLAIVQRIIQKHGGKVWAESKIGEGATIYFTIPDKKQNK